MILILMLMRPHPVTAYPRYMVRQCDAERLAHVCLLSSAGVTRTDKLPFLTRNLGGALDRKRALEGELQLRSLKQGFDYTVG